MAATLSLRKLRVALATGNLDGVIPIDGVPSGSGSGPWIDVSQSPYGATTGSADNSTILQAAHDALAAAGGGVLYIPPGTWKGQIVHDAYVSIIGAGPGVSILQAPAGSNGNVLQTRNFSALTGTGQALGSHDYALRWITFDGNNTNISTATPLPVVQLYGYAYKADAIDIRKGASTGFSSEGTNFSSPAPNDPLEAIIHASKSHDNWGDGWVWNGVHDSIMESTFAARNGRTFADAAITASSTTLTSAALASFRTTDIGRYVWIPGAGSQQGTAADGAMTLNSPTLNSATAAFTSRDVSKLIKVAGAAAAGADLYTKIKQYISPTQIVLTTPASTAVSGATYNYWNHLYAQITGVASTTSCTLDTAASTTAVAGRGNLSGTIGAVGFRFPPITGFYASSSSRSVTADLNITSGSHTLTSNGAAAFTSDDIGLIATVNGAGPGGTNLLVHITAWTSVTQVTVFAAASTTVTNADGQVGGDASGRSNGMHLSNCHSWGNQQSHAILADYDTNFSGNQQIKSTNCQYESAFIEQVGVGSHDFQLVGGNVYQAGMALDAKGVRVGTSASGVRTQSPRIIGTHITRGAPAIDLTYSGGSESIYATVEAPIEYGAQLVGTPSGGANVILTTLGGATAIPPTIAGLAAGVVPIQPRATSWIGNGGAQSTTASLTFNKALFAPFDLDVTTTITDIGLGITVLGTGVMRLGLTNTGTDGLPNQFLGGGGTGSGAHDFGTINVTGTGELHVGAAQFGSALTLIPGRYWRVAAWQTTSTTAPTIRSETSGVRGVGANIAAPPSGSQPGYIENTAGLTTTFPADCTGLTFTSTANVAHVLVLTQ